MFRGSWIVLGVMMLLVFYSGMAMSATPSPSVEQLRARLLSATDEVKLVSTLLEGEEIRLQALIESLKTPRAANVKRQIRKMGSQAVPTLIARLDENEPVQAQQIIEVLGRIGDKRALPCLLDTYQNGDNWLRCASVFAIGKIAGKEAVPILVESLQDKNNYVCGNAIRMLADLKDPRAIPALIETLRSPDRDLAESAAVALFQLSDGKANHGTNWLQWQEWYEGEYPEAVGHGGNGVH